MRFEPEVGFWCLGETYDPYKMCHSHEVVAQPVAQVRQVDEERIDSADDTYGEEDAKFDDKDPLGDACVDDPNDSPISDEFSQ